MPGLHRFLQLNLDHSRPKTSEHSQSSEKWQSRTSTDQVSKTERWAAKLHNPNNFYTHDRYFPLYFQLFCFSISDSIMAIAQRGPASLKCVAGTDTLLEYIIFDRHSVRQQFGWTDVTRLVLTRLWHWQFIIFSTVIPQTPVRLTGSEEDGWEGWA